MKVDDKTLCASDELCTPPSCIIVPDLEKYQESPTQTAKTPCEESQSYDANQCGLFQVVHVILTQLTRFTSAWALFLMSFGIYNPGWRCADTKLGNSTENQTYLYNFHLQSSHLHHNVTNKTNFFRDQEEVTNILSYSNKCPVQQWCKNIEFLPDTVTIVTQFGLICDKAYIPSIIISIQMIGMTFGSLIAGQIGESFGRKVSIYSSTAVLCLSSGLAVFSHSWEVYSVFIFGIGFGGGGILASFMIISTEFLGPKWRARFAAIPVSNIALGIFACIILICKNWVFLHLMTAAVSSLAILGAFWVPESLQWLRIHGTRKQTEKVIKKIAAVNKIPVSDKELMKALVENEMNAEKKQKVSKSTICDLFQNRAIGLLSIKALVVYCCIQTSYYTIGFGVQALAGNFYTNFLISTLTEGPVSLLVGPASNRLGRKWAASIFTVFSFAFCLSIPVVYYAASDDVSALVIRISAVMARAMILCIVQTFNIFMVELFPTPVRSIAFGFVGCFSRVGLIMAPFLIPSSKEFLPVSFSCLGGALILAVLILQTLPETKNKNLIDNMELDYDTETDECNKA